MRSFYQPEWAALGMLPRCVAQLHLHSGKHWLVEGILLCSQLYRRCVTRKDSDPPAIGDVSNYKDVFNASVLSDLGL